MRFRRGSGERAAQNRRGAAAVVGAACLLAALAIQPVGAAAPPNTVQNLQHTADQIRGPRAGHGLIAFLASEAHEGRDLNGDGIVGTSKALQLWDSQTGLIHNLGGFGSEGTTTDGVFTPMIQFGDGIAAYAVSEADTGVDRNGLDGTGDGDMNDNVLHVWTRDGGVTNLGFVLTGPLSNGYKVGGGEVVFSVTERQLHPELIAGSQDLNGNGNATDSDVMLAWDASDGSLRVIGAKSGATVEVVEDDGLFIWGSGGLGNTITAYDSSDGSSILCCSGLIYFDALTQIYDARDGYVGLAGYLSSTPGPARFIWWDTAANTFTTSTGLSVGTGPEGIAALADGWMAVVATESPGNDLNGDGDTADGVMHLWDPVNQVAINSGLAVESDYTLVAGDNTVAFVVSEDEQGADLNGDGDTSRQDRIVHIWPTSQGSPVNTTLGVTQYDMAAAGDAIAFSATQAADGTTLARRVHLWTPAGGLTDLGVNAAVRVGTTRSGIRASDGQLAFMADEAATGSDLDGDLVVGSSSDGVPTVWNPTSGLWHAPDPGVVLPNTGGAGSGLDLTGSHALFFVRESGDATDRNCDGDTNDDIVHVATIGSTPAPAACAYPVLTPGAAAVTEGDAGTVDLEVPIALSAPSVNEVTVDWETFDNGDPGIATADVDYVADSGTVTFAPGETAKTVTITVNGDLVDEPDLYLGEWALIRFSNPSPSATLDLSFFGLGIGVIVDDDPAPTIIPGFAGVTEGDVGTTTVDVPVTLSNPSATEVTVDWVTLDNTGEGFATPGLDYLADSGTVTFAPGDTIEYVTLTVIGDTIPEPPLYLGEWALVSFRNPSVNASLDTSLFGLGIGIINDDD